MAQAGTVWVNVRGDTAQFGKDIGDAAQKAGGSIAGGLGSGARAVLGDLGTAAGVASIAVGGIAAAAIKTSTEFNKSMSGVSAVAGATASEMDSLRQAALDAGAATSFSASEASSAEAELVKAGVSVSDVLGGALAGSLGLAAAGQLDLADAATISAQAMNIFGLQGSDVTHIADVLAAGANKSAADVSQLGDALRQGGLVAAQTGLNLEETTGVLSLFADQALVGSDAGTSLKTMLQRLVPQSKQASIAMEELGLQFYDAQGAFVGIDNVAQQLQDSLGGLSDEQRAAALETLFGSDAVRGASILMEGGAAAVQEYTAAVNDQGAAARMAAEQLNNLAGDVEAFSGSVETALIRFGDLADASLRGVVQGGTEFVNVFNDFADTPAWGRIQANLDRLGSAGGDKLGSLADSLASVLEGISPQEVDRIFASIEGGFTAATDAAEGLEPVIAGVGAALSTMALSSIPFVGSLVPAFSPLTGLLGGLVLGSEAGRDALAGLGKQAGELARSVGPDLLRSLSGLSGELSGGLASVLKDVGGAAIDAAKVLGPVLSDAIDELGPPIGDLIEAVGELVANVLPDLADLAGVVLPPAIDLLSGGMSIAADVTSVLADNLWLLVPALAGIAAVKFGDQIGSWASKLGDIAGAAKTAGTDFGTYFSVLRSEGASVGGALKGAANEVGGLSSALGGVNFAFIGVTAAVTAGAAVYQTWANNIREVKQAGEELLTDLQKGAEVIPRLSQQLNDAFDREGTRTDFEKTGLSIAAVSQVINENVGQMDEFRQIWNDSAKSLIVFRRTGAEIPEGVRPIIQSLLDMADQGLLTGEELNNVIDVMVDVDKNARSSAGGLEYQAEQLAKVIPQAQQTADVLADLAIAQDNTAGLDAQRDALARLAAQFPKLAAAAGVAVEDVSDSTGGLADQASRAAGELRGLADELRKLAGVELDVDEAQRRANESGFALLKTLSENGPTLDINTQAGIRNVDAIQRSVEQTKALAEAQAAMDKSGATSTATLTKLYEGLVTLRDQGLLPAGEQFDELLRKMGLLPEQIPTTVTAYTDDAVTAFDDLKDQINNLPGVSEPEKAAIIAELDAGNVAGVAGLLDAAARDRTANINVTWSADPFLKLPTGAYLQAQGVAVQPTQGGLTKAEQDYLRSLGGQDGDPATPRADGGGIWPGKMFITGEKGPELGVFPASGGIVDAATTKQILSDTLIDPKRQTGVEMSPVLAELQAVRAALMNREPVVQQFYGTGGPKQTAETSARMLRRRNR